MGQAELSRLHAAVYSLSHQCRKRTAVPCRYCASRSRPRTAAPRPERGRLQLGINSARRAHGQLVHAWRGCRVPRRAPAWQDRPAHPRARFGWTDRPPVRRTVRRMAVASVASGILHGNVRLARRRRQRHARRRVVLLLRPSLHHERHLPQPLRRVRARRTGVRRLLHARTRRRRRLARIRLQPRSPIGRRIRGRDAFRADPPPRHACVHPLPPFPLGADRRCRTRQVQLEAGGRRARRRRQGRLRFRPHHREHVRHANLELHCAGEPTKNQLAA